MIRPYSNIYSKSGVFMPRGGIGVRLPLEMLGAPAPIAVSCSYAAIPIDRYPNSFMIGNVNYLSAFSVGLEYTKGL
jgi:hypothetical protein